MKLNCKSVSISGSGGEIFQILFKSEPDQDDGPYLLLQRAFLEEEDDDDNASCYIETHGYELNGHYTDLSVKLERNQLIVKFPPPESETILVTFQASDEQYNKIKRMLKIIMQKI